MFRACERLAPLVDMLWQHCGLEVAPSPSPPAVQQPLAPPQLSPAGPQLEPAPQQPMLQPALQARGWEAMAPPGMTPAGGWGSPALPLPSLVVQQPPLGNTVAQEQQLAMAHMRQAGSQLALAQQQQAQLALARQHAAQLARQQQASPLGFAGGSAGQDVPGQPQLAMAQRLELQDREQRRMALLRLRQELMGEPAPADQQHLQPPHLQQQVQQAPQFQQQQQQQLGAPLSRQPSTLAEQQQAWLDAMAQQRPPPLQQAPGEPAPGEAHCLASLLLQGGSAPPPHERQRMVLAQLKQNMLMMQMQQPQEGAEAQQPAMQAELAGAAAGAPLPILQPQQPFAAQHPQQHPQQPQHLQQPFPAHRSLPQPAPLQQVASFGREAALSLPLSPTASMGANGHARKRPALAAQMGAAVKEAAAARPGGGAGADSDLRCCAAQFRLAGWLGCCSRLLLLTAMLLCGPCGLSVDAKEQRRRLGN